MDRLGLVGWLLVGWLVGWLVGCWLVGWLVDGLLPPPPRFTHPLIYIFMYVRLSPIHPSIRVDDD